ncbi:olfactomedin-4-like [Scleropages formosus]|uniref:Olfactomedin-4-like n=1 Tax=Scleropages formosus TaxID=113540 RepID=A0A0P7YFJ3_SCLFO|nr:olfactomedin-4-like [Scleropages formosus]KPP65383.1 olfactomedin-4-like [Scleropages formosus]
MMLQAAATAIIAVVLTFLIQGSKTSATCFCELRNLGNMFPDKRLQDVKTLATRCTQEITSEQISEIDVLLDQLHYRLLQLEGDITRLEKEDDGDLFGAVSLRIIEIELAEITDLFVKLNATNNAQQRISANTGAQLMNLRSEVQGLKKFDQTKVIMEKEKNKRLTRDLKECEAKAKVTLAPPTIPAPGNCPYGHLLNVMGPSSYITTQYGTSYPYGAWGRDPKPALGKEDWYWLVALTSSNIYANYVRQYSSYSALILGVSAGDVSIASGNPTTNTVQGPNAVLYGNALYYNCYNSPSVCRFDMTSRSISSVALPTTGYNNKFPFCHLDACYGYTDIDVATDESGVWAVYTTPQNFGNVVLSKVEVGSDITLSRTWNTSLNKRTATNTFMACGVLYGTRYIDKQNEEVFYSFDTATGQERFDLNLLFKKTSTNIQSLNYNPRDRMLYVYSDSYVLTYQVTFG